MSTKTHAERTDDLLQLLSHRHRRQTLQLLMEQPDNTATLDELLNHVNSTSDGASLATEMHHVHLPRLDESELVEWDRRSEMVRYNPDSLLERVVHVLKDQSVPSTSA